MINLNTLRFNSVALLYIFKEIKSSLTLFSACALNECSISSACATSSRRRPNVFKWYIRGDKLFKTDKKPNAGANGKPNEGANGKPTQEANGRLNGTKHTIVSRLTVG